MGQEQYVTILSLSAGQDEPHRFSILLSSPPLPAQGSARRAQVVSSPDRRRPPGRETHTTTSVLKERERGRRTVGLALRLGLELRPADCTLGTARTFSMPIYDMRHPKISPLYITAFVVLYEVMGIRSRSSSFSLKSLTLLML